MGLGKTVSYLTVARQQRWRTLLVAPKLVAQQTWPDEIQKWDHLRGMRYDYIDSNLMFDYDMSYARIHSISYDNVLHLIRLLPRELWLWDTLVFDESSKMKAPTSARMLLVKRILHHFKRRYILSGTPASEGMEGLWSQIYLLDRGKRLGSCISHYRSNYFSPLPHFHGYRLQNGSAARINAKIADLVLSMKSEDYIRLPPLVVTDIPVELPPRAMRQYRSMEKELFMLLDRKRIDATNAGVKSMKCRQAASGWVYDEDTVAHRLHDAKMEALRRVIDEAQGQHIIVAYQFKSELAALRRAFRHGRLITDPGVVAAWNKGKVSILFAHPASAGHGLNLQTGGHVIAWLSPTYSAEQYDQLHKRLHRSGQAHPVMSYRLLASRTIDRAVVASVESKGNSQNAFLDAMKAYRNAK